MSPTNDHHPTRWHTELRPDAYGKKLYITLQGGEHLLDYERREHIVNKLHAVREFLDAESNSGRERYCTVDHHAMQDAPSSVVLMGSLHDLEELKTHFDMPIRVRAKPAPLHAVSGSDVSFQEIPTPKTTQRHHLRLVVSDGVTLT